MKTLLLDTVSLSYLRHEEQRLSSSRHLDAEKRFAALTHTPLNQSQLGPGEAHASRPEAPNPRPPATRAR